MNAQQFLQVLDEVIQQKHLLKHDFYLAWSEGKLSLDCLKEYAKEYYQHVKAFPRYLSALHCHTEDMDTRKEILQNLIEEEGGNPNHPELWRMFAKGLGVTDAELDGYKPNAAMQKLINGFCDICLNTSVEEGLASLYAYESQIPAICVSKIEGLKKHYGLHNPKDWSYFSVHISADEEHAAVERKLLTHHFSQENGQKALSTAQMTVDNLWDFLTSLCVRYDIACPKM